MVKNSIKYIAIVVVIILLVVFVGLPLGLFNFSSSPATNTCTAGSIQGSSFFCTDPILTASGTLSLEIGQASGSTMYNVELACLSTANTLAYAPYEQGVAYSSITNFGSTSSNFTSGQMLSVSNIPCYGGYGLIGTEPVGTQFTGIIPVNYTREGGPANNVTNPWVTLKLATITVKVS